MTRVFLLALPLVAGCAQPHVYAVLEVEQWTFGDGATTETWSDAWASFRYHAQERPMSDCTRSAHGDCTLFECRDDWGDWHWDFDDREPVALDAGEVRFAADGVGYRLESFGTSDEADGDTFYGLEVSPIADGALVAFEADGNVVPGFYVESTMPPRPVLHAPATLVEGLDLNLTWVPITDGATLYITVEDGWAPFAGSNAIVCSPPAEAGSLTIPADLVARLTGARLTVDATATRTIDERRDRLDLAIALRNGGMTAWILR